MLSNARFALPTLPAADIKRARRFYEETLGFPVDRELGEDAVAYRAGDALIMVYETKAAHGENTAVSFVVGDLDAEMRELRGRGVIFEEYDMPGLKTVDGVVEMDGERGAWFKDSEGNILSVGEYSSI